MINKLNKLKMIGLILAILGMAGCLNVVEATTYPVRSDSVFEEAKRLAADQLRDPEAARFKSDYEAYRTSTGETIVCGTLNGKNAMGGYVGYKPFWIRIRNGVVMAFKMPSASDDYGYEAQSILGKCAEARAGTVMVMN